MLTISDFAWGWRGAPRPVLTIILTIALLAASSTAEAQPAGRVYRLALVFTATPIAEMTESANPTLRAFFGELRQLGYAEGQSLVVRTTIRAGPSERPEIAAEVVSLNPDVIVIGCNRAARAVKAATATAIVGATVLRQNGDGPAAHPAP